MAVPQVQTIICTLFVITIIIITVIVTINPVIRVDIMIFSIRTFADDGGKQHRNCDWLISGALDILILITCCQLSRYFSFFFIERECIEIIYCQYYLAIWDIVFNTLPLWKTECQLKTLPQVGMDWKIRPLRQFAPWGRETRQCIITFFNIKASWIVTVMQPTRVCGALVTAYLQVWLWPIQWF